MNNETRKIVQEAFSDLTPAQKAAWRLCKKEGRSEYEAAKILGVSQPAVADRLKWAEKKYVAKAKELNERS